MKPYRAQQICRSRNPFSPSIVLWRHFVLPCHPLRQQRLQSLATGASPGAILNDQSDANHLPELSPTTHLQSKSGGENEGAQKVVDRKGTPKRGKPRFKTIWKTLDVNNSTSFGEVEGVLQKTKVVFDGAGDYEGIAVESMKSKKSVPEHTLPWCIRSHDGNHGARKRLALEISHFHDYATPNKTEAIARRHVIERIRKDVRETLPGNILEVFGSERTGIALATSDIDLRLMSSDDPLASTGTKPPSRPERKILLGKLYKLFKSKITNNWNYILPAMRHARYPLIALQDRASGLDIQIVLSNDTSVSRDLMQQYMHEYPCLPQVYSVAKTIFDVRGFSDVYHGGFGSYSVFMMVVASLRHKPSKSDDAAEALRNFLRFWGHLDTEMHGVSVEPPELFDKSKELVMSERTKTQLLENTQKALPKYMLCLRDPADKKNDLGRKGAYIKHIQTTFRHLDHKLSLDLARNSRHSLLAPLVGDVYVINESRRKKLAKYGRDVSDNIHDSHAQTEKEISNEGNVPHQSENEAEGQKLKIRYVKRGTYFT